MLKIILAVLAAILAVGLFAFAQQQRVKKQHKITVSPPTLIITTEALPNAMVGVPYSAQILAAMGTPPYTWTLDTGSVLPAGLSLATVSSTGKITGIPTTPGDFNFTIVVTDSGTPALARRMNIIGTVPNAGG